MFNNQLAPGVDRFASCNALKSAAFLYTQRVWQKPFFSALPCATCPELNLFGRDPPPLDEEEEQAAAAVSTKKVRKKVSKRVLEEEEEFAPRQASVCDRLRNAVPRLIVVAHTLLGDPEVIKQSATEEERKRYFTELDLQGRKMLEKCKVWAGGTRYVGHSKCGFAPSTDLCARCTVDAGLFCMRYLAMLHVLICAGMSMACLLTIQTEE